MALLIKNARVFAPTDLGVQDVLMVAEQVVAIGHDLPATLPDTEVIDAKGQIMTPGFFDQHIHVTGGGGEGGPVTRTPEIMLSELVACGTTSVVGVSGTDYVTRSIPNLLAKVRALKTEGVSAWMYTSNYAFPPTTMSASVADDMFLVPECLGVKIALGDHRSSFPTTQEVLALLAEIRVAGMISGKIGLSRALSTCTKTSSLRASPSSTSVRRTAVASATSLTPRWNLPKRAVTWMSQQVQAAALTIPPLP
jgi:beta-aspartyl-dipeptidase (metallo-type)